MEKDNLTLVCFSTFLLLFISISATLESPGERNSCARIKATSGEVSRRSDWQRFSERHVAALEHPVSFFIARNKASAREDWSAGLSDGVGCVVA
jgi:hypothetical protein